MSDKAVKHFWKSFYKDFNYCVSVSGKSMSTISDEIGISKATISRIARGNDMDAKSFVKVCTWMNSKSNNALSIADFDINSRQEFSEKQEEEIYGMVEKMTLHVNNRKFDGNVVISGKTFQYANYKGSPIELCNEVVKRLRKFGKWESYLMFIEKTPYICIYRKDLHIE